MTDFPPDLIERLRRAQHVLVVTGAGISAESGVPTFRDAQTGYWAKFRAEDLATPEAFARAPKTVWEWYASRRKRVAQVKPNPGHEALVNVSANVPRLTLVTQNVDGLHQRAGSQEVIELHGNIQRTRCSLDDGVIESWPTTKDVPPRCPHCSAHLRPDVVWFGEDLPREAIDRAWQAAETCDFCLSVGTSALVYPAASLGLIAQRRGVAVLEVNLEATPLSDVADWSLRGKAGEILPELVARTWPK